MMNKLLLFVLIVLWWFDIIETPMIYHFAEQAQSILTSFRIRK
jgi:hypothetical protein